jgi:hypothetical protein
VTIESGCRKLPHCPPPSRPLPHPAGKLYPQLPFAITPLFPPPWVEQSTTTSCKKSFTKTAGWLQEARDAERKEVATGWEGENSTDQVQHLEFTRHGSSLFDDRGFSQARPGQVVTEFNSNGPVDQKAGQRKGKRGGRGLGKGGGGKEKDIPASNQRILVREGTSWQRRKGEGAGNERLGLFSAWFLFFSQGRLAECGHP